MRRVAGALSLALLLLTTIAGPASAVDWDGERKLSSTESAGQELLRTGPLSALMVWRRGTSVLARRTVDAGRTWLPVRTLATSVGLGSAVASVGARVDLVYARATTCASTGEPAQRITYRSSTDGGVTWSAPVSLTSTCSETYQPAVARTADGQVSVAWVGIYTGRIFVRTSRDGGATFAPAVQAASTSASVIDTCAGCRFTFWADPAIAIGSSGTTYLAYTSAQDRISIRRSANRGATWAAQRLLTASAGSSLVELVATGARALVGYRTSTPGIGRSVYRTTADRGATWSAARGVMPLGAGEFSTDAQFTVQGGTLAVVVKAGPPGASPVWYRESTNFGATWSAPVEISADHGPQPDPVPAGVALLDGTALAGYAEVGETTGLWVRGGDR